jgi:NAD-dependent SIR2 family protein deacetylase
VMDDGHTVLETATCVCCGEKFEAEFVVIAGKPFGRPSRCNVCEGKENERRQEQERQRALAKRARDLAETIPALYLDTDQGRLHPKLRELIEGFEANSSDGV